MWFDLFWLFFILGSRFSSKNISPDQLCPNSTAKVPHEDLLDTFLAPDGQWQPLPCRNCFNNLIPSWKVFIFIPNLVSIERQCSFTSCTNTYNPSWVKIFRQGIHIVDGERFIYMYSAYNRVIQQVKFLKVFSCVCCGVLIMKIF